MASRAGLPGLNEVMDTRRQTRLLHSADQPGIPGQTHTRVDIQGHTRGAYKGQTYAFHKCEHRQVRGRLLRWA
jgi:hypothetical protein